MNNKGWLIALLMVNSAIAEVAVRDDGKRVELNSGGTWEYISEDVLATSASGLRVLLSPDGRWQVAADNGNTVARTAPLEPSQFNDLVYLQSIEIQKVKESRPSAKSTVFQQNMVAQLVFDVLPSTELLTASNFTVNDSKGKSYPVISAHVGVRNIVHIRAEGAPDRWSRTKSLNVILNKQLLGTLSDVNLSVDFRDIKTKIYSAFSD